MIAALRSHAATCEEARKNAEYFSNNRERMNYPKFRAMGLCVATGVVEGGCKNIVGARLKHGGMRWTVAGANAIIALRCAVREQPLRRLLGTSRLRKIMSLTNAAYTPLPVTGKGHTRRASLRRGAAISPLPRPLFVAGYAGG